MQAKKRLSGSRRLSKYCGRLLYLIDHALGTWTGYLELRLASSSITVLASWLHCIYVLKAFDDLVTHSTKMPLPYYNGYQVPFGQPPVFPPPFHNGYNNYTNGWMAPPDIQPLYPRIPPPPPVPAQDSSPVDVYWKRRLAPLPGCSSPQDLLGGIIHTNEATVAAVTIKKPPESRRIRAKRKQQREAKDKETLAKRSPTSDKKSLSLDKYVCFHFRAGMVGLWILVGGRLCTQVPSRHSKTAAPLQCPSSVTNIPISLLFSRNLSK